MHRCLSPLAACVVVAAAASALRARDGLTPLAAAQNFEQYIFDMLTRGDYDDYWKQGDVNWSEHYRETADIPNATRTSRPNSLTSILRARTIPPATT